MRLRERERERDERKGVCARAEPVVVVGEAENLSQRCTFITVKVVSFSLILLLLLLHKEAEENERHAHTYTDCARLSLSGVR